MPSFYGYVRHKAVRLATISVENYRKDDYFHYPLKEWDIAQIKGGATQIAYYLKGISPDHCITLRNRKGAEELLLTFHLNSVGEQKLVNKEKKI